MPSTPKKHKRLEKDQFWYTPKSLREMTTQLELLHHDLDGFNRGFRTLYRKAGLEIDRLVVNNVMIEQQVQYLEAKIELKKVLGRKVVKVDPNQTFATIDDIQKAKEEAKKQAAAYVARHGNTAAEDVEEIQKTEFESLYGTFQLV